VLDCADAAEATAALNTLPTAINDATASSSPKSSMRTPCGRASPESSHGRPRPGAAAGGGNPAWGYRRVRGELTGLGPPHQCGGHSPEPLRPRLPACSAWCGYLVAEVPARLGGGPAGAGLFTVDTVFLTRLSVLSIMEAVTWRVYILRGDSVSRRCCGPTPDTVDAVLPPSSQAHVPRTAPIAAAARTVAQKAKHAAPTDAIQVQTTCAAPACCRPRYLTIRRHRSMSTVRLWSMTTALTAPPS
jgi:hypothetical protein